jgi:hypothetical protein
MSLALGGSREEGTFLTDVTFGSKCRLRGLPLQLELDTNATHFQSAAGLCPK